MMTGQLFHAAAAPFEAARHVDILPAGHRARRLHGHSFLARVRAKVPEQWADFPGDETRLVRARLAACVAPFDYACLNDIVETPTDENLARWVRERLDIPGIDLVGIQSTGDQGADIDEHMHAHVWRRFRFEAAHELPNVPEGHQCGRMHGHGFEVILHADQHLAGEDMGVDFDQLALIWEPLAEELDHACLNDIAGLENPTSEVIARWIWQRVKPELPQLSWVTVFETNTSGCHYNGAEFRIWKEQRFEAAVQFHRAPADDRRRRLHGHSYLIRLHLSAPLDEVLGWTVDYGDVKQVFKPVYEQIDHHRLDLLNEIGDGDEASILGWVRGRMGDCLPGLDRIDLYQTPGCGAVLCWGDGRPVLPV